jgi:phosphoglycolate phosphatase-like HAD superfamily hydrolase
VTAAVLLWDFGDTLVDERWMLRPPEGCPAWANAWAEVMGHYAAEWDVGAVSWAQVTVALAERTGLTVEAVAAHARRCCRDLAFNPAAWRVANDRRLPQAIVTVNPDLFTDHVVPAHDLARVFDVIVASWTEGTTDKPELCDIALRRLGFGGARSEALLIDNRADLVEAWRDRGGAGYWYRGDAQFERDLPALLS